METNRSYVRYIIKKSVTASGGIGFELETCCVEGTSEEILLELGKKAIKVAGDLAKEEIR